MALAYTLFIVSHLRCSQLNHCTLRFRLLAVELFAAHFDRRGLPLPMSSRSFPQRCVATLRFAIIRYINEEGEFRSPERGEPYL